MTSLFGNFGENVTQRAGFILFMESHTSNNTTRKRALYMTFLKIFTIKLKILFYLILHITYVIYRGFNFSFSIIISIISFSWSMTYTHVTKDGSIDLRVHLVPRLVLFLSFVTAISCRLFLIGRSSKLLHIKYGKFLN